MMKKNRQKEQAIFDEQDDWSDEWTEGKAQSADTAQNSPISWEDDDDSWDTDGYPVQTKQKKRVKWWIPCLAIAAVSCLLLVIFLTGQRGDEAGTGALIANQSPALSAQETPFTAAPTQTASPAQTQAVLTNAPAITNTPSPSPSPVQTAASIEPSAAGWALYPSEMRPFVGDLSDSERELFALIYDGLFAFEQQIDLKGGPYSEKQLDRVLHAIDWDCPELIGFTGNCSAVCDDRYVLAIEPEYGFASAAEWKNAYQTMIDRAEQIISNAPTEAYARECYFYRWIIEHCAYDEQAARAYDADGVIVSGSAVCEGYARAFQLLCRMGGLPNLYIAGEDKKTGVGHAWNKVQIAGEWYATDLTWDRAVYEKMKDEQAPLDGLLLYFNLTDEEMEQSRRVDADLLQTGLLPVCSATTYSFFNHNAWALPCNADWKDALITQLNLLEAGECAAAALVFDDKKSFQKASDGMSDAIKAWQQAAHCRCKLSASSWGDEDYFIIALYVEERECSVYQTTSFWVEYLSMGNADGAVVCCDGCYMLIDGGTTKAGSSMMYSYLLNHGITAVEAVIATHPHDDHIGGLSGALSLEDCAFGVIYTPILSSDKTCLDTLTEKAAARNVSMTVPDRGDSFMLGSARVTFLSPQKGRVYEEMNDMSLVVLVEYGDTKFLFMGDAEEASEQDLMKYDAAMLSADVIKIGHHGGNTSSSAEFLQAVSPIAAVISCSGSEGHPAEATVERLNQLGTCTVLRTDQNGNIIILSDGTNLTYCTDK